MHTSRKRASLWWVSLTLLFVYLLSLPTAALAATKKEVKITVDGQPVTFDVQPYIDGQNRTIVPIRFIGEKLGYQFDWDSKGKVVTVTGNGSVLKIWINNKQASVNGTTVTMDTVAVLDQGRAMVPLRFIVENMGASISYDQRTGVVNVTKVLSNNDTQVEVSEVVQINSPIVNIRSGPGTQYDIVTKAKLGDTFTVVLKQDGWNQIVLPNGQKAWVVASAVDPVEVSTPTEQQKDPESVEQISSKVAVISESVVNIRSGPGTDYSVLTKASFGTSFNITGQKGDWYEVALADSKGWVAGWLVSIRDTTDSASRSEEPGERREELTKPQPQQLNTILDVEVEAEDDEVYLTISGQEKLSYSSFRLDNPRRIVLDFPGAVLVDPNSIQTIEVNHDLVHTIRVAQFNSEQVRVVLDLAAAAGINLLDSADDGKVLAFEVGKPSIKGKTIVLDPGHASVQSWGSSDPGAIGPSGLMEKDVVLDIAQKTAELLKAKGARVIMTRTGDTYLSLADRAEVANSNNADIFVSIHCNSNTKSTAKGTSTYYYDNGIGQAEVRKKLASAVQSELLRALGTKNLGVLQANFAVLRHTLVPSILVETAFISNPEEEQLLRDPSFRAKVAEGIANGIELFFTE